MGRQIIDFSWLFLLGLGRYLNAMTINSLAYVKYHPLPLPKKSRLGRLKPCFTCLSMPVRSYLPGSTCALLEKKEFVLCSFVFSSYGLKVSRAHADNYRDGPMYNGPWAWFASPIFSNPLEPPPPPPCVRPCKLLNGGFGEIYI